VATAGGREALVVDVARAVPGGAVRQPFRVADMFSGHVSATLETRGMARATLGCMSQCANSTHAELWLRAKAEAGALRQGAYVQDLVLAKRPTTHWQRQQIRAAIAVGADRSLADLLDALASQIHHGQHIPGDAEQLLQDPATSLLSLFGPKPPSISAMRGTWWCWRRRTWSCVKIRRIGCMAERRGKRHTSGRWPATAVWLLCCRSWRPAGSDRVVMRTSPVGPAVPAAG
jgi:hypothetical protein